MQFLHYCFVSNLPDSFTIMVHKTFLIWNSKFKDCFKLVTEAKRCLTFMMSSHTDSVTLHEDNRNAQNHDIVSHYPTKEFHTCMGIFYCYLGSIVLLWESWDYVAPIYQRNDTVPFLGFILETVTYVMVLGNVKNCTTCTSTIIQ